MHPITGKDVLIARTLMGWSQRQLSERSGVSARTILRVEEGKADPHPLTWTKLIDAFQEYGLRFATVSAYEATYVEYKSSEWSIRHYLDGSPPDDE